MTFVLSTSIVLISDQIRLKGVRACVCVCVCVCVRQLKHLQMALVLPHQELITQTWGRCRYASQKPKSGVCIYAHRFVTRGVCLCVRSRTTQNMSHQKSTKPFTKFSASISPCVFLLLWKIHYEIQHMTFFLLFFSLLYIYIYIYIYKIHTHTHTHTIIINTHIWYTMYYVYIHYNMIHTL